MVTLICTAHISSPFWFKMSWIASDSMSYFPFTKMSLHHHSPPPPPAFLLLFLFLRERERWGLGRGKLLKTDTGYSGVSKAQLYVIWFLIGREPNQRETLRTEVSVLWTQCKIYPQTGSSGQLSLCSSAHALSRQFLLSLCLSTTAPWLGLTQAASVPSWNC